MKVSASHNWFISFSLLAWTFALLAFNASAATNQQDVNALIALRNAWSSSPSSWDTSTDPCEGSGWLGVYCDSTSTRVTKLLLINQDLDGNLPSEIGDLTNLTDLDLSSNRKLVGTLPPAIGNLTSLYRFFLQNCGFSGKIPSEIGNLTNLHYLGLNQNSFTGTIPATIGQLSQLIWFDVSSNNLSGSLPDSSNGGIGLDNLTQAQHLHLHNNSFSGSIPSTLFNSQMTSLLHLLLHNNSFSGPIPSSTAGDLPQINILRMDFNKLNGSINSDTISGLTSLTVLQVDNNELTGPVPDLSNMTKLQILTLGNNQFVAAEIPSWISTLQNMSLIGMQSANLIGEVPADIFNLSGISNVTLGSNSLNGTLDLQNASPSLLLVDVQNNNISSLEKGNYSQDLNLVGNPVCTSNLNECTQSAPSPSAATLSDCSCSDPYAPNPTAPSGQCTCSLPLIIQVDFSAYNFPIFTAEMISDMEQQYADGLTAHVNFNVTKGQVVLNFVSSTEATLSIFPPSTLEAWTSNDAVQISYWIKNQAIQFVLYGPYLCEFNGSPYGQVIVRGLSTGAKIGIGLGVAAFVIVVLVVGLYAFKQKKRADKAELKSKPFAAWIANGEENADIPQLKGARWFSFDEIKRATNNFSERNEIGEGGYGKVYKGFILSGEPVAIKRAQASSLQGAAEFKNEIELLSRVHHKNLVGLIGFCFEQGEQMLVYEFMPNGTMRDCLTGRNGLRMDWERRVALALGSARGIAYLHSEANPPIIHRDIKSSNILLDEKLVAKVADFGLSVLAPTEGDEHVTTQVKGTLGYLDPEYYTTNRLTDKSDVYSFGVVLLELITARQPIENGKFIVREVRTALDKGGMDYLAQNILDPYLTDYPIRGLESILSIALSCVEEESLIRPAMGEVVKDLEALVRKPGAVEMQNMGSERADLYAESSPYMQQAATGTSFEYSGMYGMPANIVEPK